MGAKGKQDIIKRCPVCLKSFGASKHSAVYCSATCRQRAHRKPPIEQRLREFYDDGRAAIVSLAAVANGHSFEAYRAQKRLQSLALEILQNVDDRTKMLIYDQMKEDFYRVLRDKDMSRHRPEVEA